MKAQIVPMTCAACDVTMNPHAEKPVDPVSADEAERADQASVGLLEEIHQCPRCGGVRSRRVS